MIFITLCVIYEHTIYLSTVITSKQLFLFIFKLLKKLDKWPPYYTPNYTLGRYWVDKYE